MKLKHLLIILFIAGLVLLLISCEKPVRDNPWDEFSTLDPEEWAPTNLQVEAMSITERKLSWEYVGDERIVGFIIDRKHGDDDWIEGYTILGKDARLYTDTITPNLNTYFYRVYAFAGALKSIMQETNIVAIFPAPSSLTHTINSYTSVTLQWIYNSYGHMGFQLERKSDNGSWITIASDINPIIRKYTDNQYNWLESNYIYRLRAFSNSYFSEYSVKTELRPVVTNPITGKTWMDRNLGAKRVAESSTDDEAYGDLYQWGRGTDGHEKRTSGTTSTLSSIDNPSHGNFFLVYNSPFDWRSPQNVNLWQGVNGINNPCPSGFRLPTQAEWEEERLSWNSNNSAGAFTSILKLPSTGYRVLTSGSITDVGTFGHYWSSNIIGTNSDHIYFNISNAAFDNSNRAYGFSIRCIKD